MGEQRPAGKGLANGIWGEGIAAWSEYQGPFVKAARGQWDVPSDYDVIHRDMLSNPVIGGVELPCDNNKVDRTQIRNSNPRVGDHCNVEPVSLRNPAHLLLYGAAIGIDEYFKHSCPLPAYVSLWGSTACPWILGGKHCPSRRIRRCTLP